MTIREYPDSPLIGVGAIVFNDEDKILLIERGNDPHQGLWAFPGGMIELGEKIDDALKREVKEECNIEIHVEGIADGFDLILKDDDGDVRFHYIILNYYATYINGDLLPGDDVNDAQWFSYDDVDSLNIPDMARQAIDKAFQDHV